MNKDRYNSAMDKIKVSVRFKNDLVWLMKKGEGPRTSRKARLLPALIALVLVISVAIGLLPGILNNLVNRKQMGSDAQEGQDMQGDYIAVVYLNGYAYEPSVWSNYSIYGEWGIESTGKGKKLGEVTLDLRGKKNIGRPPNFSSTYEVGTEIFEIKGIKAESAVLVKRTDGYENIFYRERKIVKDLDEPIGLNINEVFNMRSKDPEAVAVEVRSEENASWVRTTMDEKLLGLINRELPQEAIKNWGEASADKFIESHRIPLNLLFKDGQILHMQVFPKNKAAWVFGGFIKIPDELISRLEILNSKGDEFTRASDLLSFKEDEISYLYLKDYRRGKEIVTENPLWSGGPLYNMLTYYQVEKSDGDPGGNLAFSASMGKAKDDKVDIDFYESPDESISMSIDGVYYEIVKGQLRFDFFKDYLINYTELGL